MLFQYNPLSFLHSKTIKLNPIDKHYSARCLYPLKTHSLAEAECVLPMSCGDPFFHKFDSAWYGEEWGVCYGEHLFQHELYTFSIPDPLHIRYCDAFGHDCRPYVVSVRLDHDSKFITDSIYIYRDDDCLTYKPRHCFLSEDDFHRIHFHETGNRAGIFYQSPNPYDFDKLCASRCFLDLKELIRYLNLGFVHKNCTDFHFEYHSSDCKYFFNETHGRTEKIFDPDYKDFAYSPIQNCSNPLSDTEYYRPLSTAYSNPIVSAFKSLFNILLVDLGYVLKFIVYTFLEVAQILLLDLLNFLILNVPFVVELMVTYICFFSYTGSLIRSVALSVPIYLTILIIKTNLQSFNNT